MEPHGAGACQVEPTNGYRERSLTGADPEGADGHPERLPRHTTGRSAPMFWLMFWLFWDLGARYVLMMF